MPWARLSASALADCREGGENPSGRCLGLRHDADGRSDRAFVAFHVDDHVPVRIFRGSSGGRLFSPLRPGTGDSGILEQIEIGMRHQPDIGNGRKRDLDDDTLADVLEIVVGIGMEV